MSIAEALGRLAVENSRRYPVPEDCPHYSEVWLLGDRKVLIVGGSYLMNGRVSNMWRVREILDDALGPVESACDNDRTVFRRYQR